MADLTTISDPVRMPHPTQALAPLQLRVIGTERNGQVIAINAARCTIGSAEHSTLRLRSSSVRPLQCMIQRDAFAAVVQCFSGDTLLNGRLFREERLQAGDRLRIGPIELAVADTGIPSQSPTQELRFGQENVAPRPPQVIDNDAVKMLARLERLEQQLTGVQQKPLDGMQPPGNVETEQAADERKQLEATLADTKQQLESATTLAEQRKIDLDSANACIEKQAQDQADMQRTLQGLRSEIEEGCCRSQRVEAELKAQLAEAREASQALQGERVTLQELLATEQRLREELENDLSVQSETVRTIAARREELQGLYDRTRLEAQGNIVDLQKRLDQLAAEQVLIESEREAWQNERLSMQASLVTEQQLRIELERDFEAQTEEHEKLSARCNQLERLHQESLAEVANIRERQIAFEAAQRQFEQDREAWTAERHQAQQTLDSERQAYEELRIRLAAEAQQSADLTERMNALQNELERERNSKLLDGPACEKHPSHSLTPEPIVTARPVSEPSLPCADSTGPVRSGGSPLNQLRAKYEPRQELGWLAQQFAANENAESVPFTEQEASVATPATIDAATEPAQNQLDQPSRDAEPTLASRQQALFSPNYLAGLQTEAELAIAEPIVKIASEPQDELSNHDDSETPATRNLESEDDVFARLALAGIWKQNPDPSRLESHVVACRPDADESDAAEQTNFEPSVAIARIANDAQGTAPNPTGDDDSIEDYMQRLLHRMRGSDSTDTMSTATMTAEHGPITEIDISNSDVSLGTPKALTLEEYQPRSQPPELGSDLAAMRQLSNEDRNENIRSHAQREWTNRSKMKLFGAMAGGATALSACFYLQTHPILAACGLVAGLGNFLFWGWQSFQFRRQLFASLKLDLASLAPHQRGPSQRSPNMPTHSPPK